MKSRLRALLKPRSGEHAPGRAVTAICSAKRLARYLPTSDNCVDASSGRALEFALRESSALALINGARAMIISCIAYDPVQDLLAVAVQANGASQGKAMPCAVIVFGGRAVERQFQVPNAIGDDAVAHGVPRILAFKPGDGLLLAVVGHNRLVAWNLLRGVVEYDIVVALPLGDKDCISTLEAPCGTRWVFVGMAGSGAVTVLDGERGLRTHFVILCQLVDDEKGASASRFSDFQPSDSAVVATLIHPHVADELLIGYAGGVVVVVSLRDQLILKRYDINRNAPPSSRIQLTALSWKYDGTAFAAGYTDGLIAIWSYDIELKPTMTFFIDDTPVSSTTDKSQKYSECRDGEAKVTHFPIYQLHWEMQSTTVTSSTTSVNLISPASVLIITGGSLQSGIALNGVRLLHIDERQSAILRQQFLATGDHEINQCLPFSLSPWFGMDSKAVALIHSDGSLALLSTVSNGTTFGSPSALPASLRLALSSPLDAFTVNSQLPAHAFNRLTLLSSPEQSILPMLDGGVTGLPRDRPSSISSRRSSSNSDDEEDNIRTSPTCNDVLITIHQDSTVRIWDASMSILRDLGMDLNLAVDLLDEMGDFTKSDAPGITLVDMAHFKGFGTVMWVALRDGVVLFFKFALETRADDQSSLTGCIDGIQEVRDGATPGFQRIWKVTRYAGKSIVDIVSGGDGLFMIIDESGRFSVMNVKTGKLESEGTVGNDRCEGVETSAITGPLITSSCLTTSYVKRTATDGKEEAWSRETLILSAAANGSLRAISVNQPEASQRVLRSSGDPVLYVDVVDAHAQLVDIDLTSSYLAQAEIGSTPPTHNYMLVVTSHSVDLCYCISDVILFTYAVDRSAIAQARIVYFAGGIAGIVLILAEGSIRVLSLLKLELLFEIDALVESDSVDSAVITSDGRIFYHDHGGFLKTASLLEHFSPHGLAEYQCKLHNRDKRFPDRIKPSANSTPTSSTGDVAAQKATPKWLGAIVKGLAHVAITDRAASHPWTSLEAWCSQWKALDMLFDGYIVKSTRHSQRIRDEREELLPEDARLAAEGRTNGKMNAPDSAGALGDAAKNLDERGQRLERLEDKFSDLAQQSDSFLENIREYNRRQAAKKWYELW